MSPLPTILNFRDVGKTINEQVKSKVMQTGKLYRSARPDDASTEDRQKIVSEYKIKSIIDLRTKTEHIQNAEKRKANVTKSEALPQSNDDAAEAVEIPGVTYHNINFNGRAYSKMLISQLSWGNTFKLIGRMAIGHRTEGIRVLGENVMTARGLVGLATDSTDASTKEVLQFFSVLAEPNQLPVLVHCTQGKDRTGLTVLFALMLLHIELGAAGYDYMLSQGELVSERAERLKEINAIGLPDSFADCDPELVKTVDEHIRHRYGSIEGYLEHAGVDKEMQERVKKNLLVEADSRQHA